MYARITEAAVHHAPKCPRDPERVLGVAAEGKAREQARREACCPVVEATVERRRELLALGELEREDDREGEEQDGEQEEPAPVAVVVVVSPECAVVGAVDAVPIVVVPVVMPMVVSVMQVSGRDSRRIQSVCVLHV